MRYTYLSVPPASFDETDPDVRRRMTESPYSAES